MMSSIEYDSASDNDGASDNDSASEYESEDEHLDTHWLATFKAEECNYAAFYPEPIKSITLYLLYIDRAKEITAIDTHECVLDETSTLKHHALITLIKQYQSRASISYKLNSLLRYNVDLEPEEIADFVSETVSTNRFLTSEKYLTDIHFKASIPMFQELNSLYFIYNEVPNNTIQTSTHTKRINLSTKHRKTMRNNKNKNLKIRKEIK